MVESIIQIKTGITTNVVASSIKPLCETDLIKNSAACSFENSKYLASIIDNSVIKN